MTKDGSFKLSAPLEKRIENSQNIRKKYPNRVPVVCEVSRDSQIVLDKNKYLVPKNITVGQLQYIIRKKVPNLNHEQALYMFIGNTLAPIAREMGDIYEDRKDQDGFLYVVINTENTFGRNL